MINETDIEGMRQQEPPEMLCQFIKAFNGSLDPRLWIGLVKEEIAELRVEDPGTAAHLKELCDVLYVITGLTLTLPVNVAIMMSQEELNEVDEIQTSLDKIISGFIKFYSPLVVTEAFARVHESNMSKLGVDGKPILREDGKVLKGPNYKKPDLTDLIKKDV